jgi:hypothetical protein
VTASVGRDFSRSARGFTALTILLIAGAVLALIVAVAMSLRAGTLTIRMIEELKAESARAENISVFANSGTGWDAVQRDRQRRFWMAPTTAVVSGLAVTACWFWLVLTLAARPHDAGMRRKLEILSEVNAVQDRLMAMPVARKPLAAAGSLTTK